MPGLAGAVDSLLDGIPSCMGAAGRAGDAAAQTKVGFFCFRPGMPFSRPSHEIGRPSHGRRRRRCRADQGECHSLCFSMGDVPMRAEILEGCLVSHAAAVTPR